MMRENIGQFAGKLSMHGRHRVGWLVLPSYTYAPQRRSGVPLLPTPAKFVTFSYERTTVRWQVVHVCCTID